ncbi:MAG: M43 family zinc metalloprotease [Bacteroidota bacterium]
MKLKITITLILMALVGMVPAIAQNASEYDVIRCYTMEADAQLRHTHPELGTLDQFENWLAPLVEKYKQNIAANARVNAITTIPIVFHVIHDSDPIGAGDNLSATLINAQVTQLNNDFRRIAGTSGFNSDPVGADTEIEFCPATVDPNGNPMSEPGINRISRSSQGWTAPPYGVCLSGGGFDDSYIENTIKPQSQWNPNEYLNIWVLDVNCGILGYAQFPSSSGLPGLNSNGGASSTDGVVVIPRSVGSTTNPGGSPPYDKGRTLTHEIGHWIGLRHIWGDGGCGVDDFCNDTPLAGGSNFGCPNASSCGSSDMVENYMDYTNDDCMNIYTQDQKSRMQTVLSNSPRRGILASSSKCGGVSNPCASSISTFPYSESFESGLGDWSQSSSDDFDWARRSGTTPSSGTGPSSAASGTFYVYVEASNPNFPSRRTLLNGPCFDLPSNSQVNFSFQYHMLGNAVGTVDLEVSTDGGSSWTSVWNQSGTQGSNWNAASVNLSSYAGSTIQVRYNALTATSWQGDIAIDDISVTAVGTAPSCANTVSSFPYAQGFESGFGTWTQSGSDDFDWTRRSGGTPSNNTGPSGASEGSFYAYTESSTPNYPNRVATLESPCFDLAGASQATFDFQYHLFGASAMGNLVLEASSNNGTSWANVWNRNGNQGNAWLSASVDLNSYAGGDLRLRFVGTTGTTWQGDMAIDDLSLSTGGGGGGCTNVNISITFDNYPEETSWEIRQGATVVASGGTYGSQPDGSTLNLTECLPDGCYDFVILDGFGDGICCAYGNGSYLVTEGGSTLASGGNFGSSETTSFCVSGGTKGAEAANATEREGLLLFPNPTNATLNYLYASKVDAPATLRISDLTGRILKAESIVVLAGMNQQAIDVQDFPAGSYLLTIAHDNALMTKRFVVTK